MTSRIDGIPFLNMHEKYMEITVFLPDLTEIEMEVDKSTPLMDILVQIATTYKFSPSSHAIQVSQSHGDGQGFHKPSTPIGSLNTSTLYVVRKTKGQKAAPEKAVSSRPPKVEALQHSFRLQVHLPCNQLHVIRVTPKTNLGDVLYKICDEKDLDVSKYELRHPIHPEERLCLNYTLGDYEISEVRLACISNRTLGALLYPGAMRDGDVGKAMLRRSKSSIGDSSASSDSFNDGMESREVSPVPSEAPNAPAPAVYMPLSKKQASSLPRHKKRPAPKPPEVKAADPLPPPPDAASAVPPCTLAATGDGGDQTTDARVTTVGAEIASNLQSVSSASTSSLASATASRRKKPPPPPPSSEQQQQPLDARPTLLRMLPAGSDGAGDEGPLPNGPFEGAEQRSTAASECGQEAQKQQQAASGTPHGGAVGDAELAGSVSSSTNNRLSEDDQRAGNAPQLNDCSSIPAAAAGAKAAVRATHHVGDSSSSALQLPLRASKATDRVERDVRDSAVDTQSLCLTVAAAATASASAVKKSDVACDTRDMTAMGIAISPLANFSISTYEDRCLEQADYHKRLVRHTSATLPRTKRSASFSVQIRPQTREAFKAPAPVAVPCASLLRAHKNVEAGPSLPPRPKFNYPWIVRRSNSVNEDLKYATLPSLLPTGERRFSKTVSMQNLSGTHDQAEDDAACLRAKAFRLQSMPGSATNRKEVPQPVSRQLHTLHESSFDSKESPNAVEFRTTTTSKMQIRRPVSLDHLTTKYESTQHLQEESAKGAPSHSTLEQRRTVPPNAEASKSECFDQLRRELKVNSRHPSGSQADPQLDGSKIVIEASVANVARACEQTEVKSQKPCDDRPGVRYRSVVTLSSAEPGEGLKAEVNNVKVICATVNNPRSQKGFRVPKPVTQMEARHQLCEAIKNFGGQANLKKVPVKRAESLPLNINQAPLRNA